MRRTPPPRPSPCELRRRLARLQRISAELCAHAHLGRLVRLSLRRAGSPTWPPSEDLSWCGWIEREGDGYARELAAEIEIALVAREGDPVDDGRGDVEDSPVQSETREARAQ